MMSFIKFRKPVLHDNFFESLWMWDFQLRFSSRVIPRNLASLTCFITTLLIFRHRLESRITFLSGLRGPGGLRQNSLEIDFIVVSDRGE